MYKCTVHNKSLTTFETLLLNILYQSGYSPSRWKNTLDILLHKKPDRTDLINLRSISLLEADFNLFYRYFGKWAMSKFIDFQYLAKEQYGSRKGHKAIDQALNKRLFINMTALQHTAFVPCYQDIIACFDRICHAALVIGLTRQNLPSTEI